MNSNIFVIPHVFKKYIVYLPLHGILFKANASAVNIFHKALSGNKTAMEKFGLSKTQITNIIDNENNHFVKQNKTKIFKPTSVSLFLTSNCSMKCAYCYASAGDRHSQIKEEYIKVAINEVIKNALLLNHKNITVNYHGGGDIGVVWDLVEKTTSFITKKAKENNLKIFFNVGLNGVLSDYQRKWIVKNINSATVSLDGDKEIQNMLRPLKNGRPSFDIVHKTLKYFDLHGFNYAIRSTATAETIGQLNRIITFFCENYEVRKIKIEPVFIQGRASQNSVNMPAANEFVENFLKAAEIASSFNKELLYSGARFELITNIFCQAAGSSFGVTPEGYITSCYEVLEKSNPVSDVFFYGKIQNGKVIIDQDKLNKLSEFTVENKEKCRNCFAKFHCAGDCPVKSVLSENDEKNRDYRCTINRELTKYQLLEAIK